jgi:hypothetical protein
METLAGRSISYIQVRSPEISYSLETEIIADAFADAPRYKQNIAPIALDAINTDYLKPEQKQHADYLLKAAEIVRREPYCQEIKLVNFSVPKSKAGHPMIFVQYQHQRSVNKWVNHYLTLPEINSQYQLLDPK